MESESGSGSVVVVGALDVDVVDVVVVDVVVVDVVVVDTLVVVDEPVAGAVVGAGPVVVVARFAQSLVGVGSGGWPLLMAQVTVTVLLGTYATETRSESARERLPTPSTSGLSNFRRNRAALRLAGEIDRVVAGAAVDVVGAAVMLGVFDGAAAGFAEVVGIVVAGGVVGGVVVLGVGGGDVVVGGSVVAGMVVTGWATFAESSALQVAVSTTPVDGSLTAAWKSATARAVDGPKLPSIAPG